MDRISVTLAEKAKEKPTGSKIPFGTFLTDHMFIMDYKDGKGWHNSRIIPYGPFSIDPSAMVLHYAQEIFEGLKAYRASDGHIRLFRPRDNIDRMNNSGSDCVCRTFRKTCLWKRLRRW